MEHRFIRLLAVLLCIFGGTALLPLAVSAAQTGNSFSAHAELPANQINPEAAYFDLAVEPLQEQDLTVRIAHPAARAIGVTVEVITASTNRNGFIHYATMPDLMDENLPFLFSDIAQVEQAQLTIPAGGSEEAKIHIAMPEDRYEGTMLGAIRVTKQIDEEELDGETGIVNQYRYTIGLRLSQGVFAGEAEFALRSVGMELANYKAAIVAKITNPQPILVKGLQAEVTVYPLGSDTPMIQLLQQDVEIAPYSVFPMTLTDAAGYGFAAGNYVAQVTLEHQGRRWSFEESFEILPERAEYVNKNAVNQSAPNPKGFAIGYVIAGLLAVLVVVVLVCILRVRRKG